MAERPEDSKAKLEQELRRGVIVLATLYQLREEQYGYSLRHALAQQGMEVEEGRALFVCTPAEYHYNPIGAVHGGLACTLLDSAMGCAVHTMLPAGVGYTTVELKVSFLRPITLKTGRLLCEGTIIHLGSRIATAEARLLDTSGKLYGHATTTCMILRNLAPEQSKPSVGE